jgi:hypothetical protein
MKTQNRTAVVLLLIISVTLTSTAPLAVAQGGNGKQNTGGQDSSANQGPSTTAGGSGGGPGGQGPGSQEGPGDSQGNDSGHQYRYRYQYQRRNVDIDGNGNHSWIRSQCRDNSTKETFEISFSVDTTPTLQLSFLPDINATTGQNQFILVIEQLIEYIDRNANGKYDGSDTIFSVVYFENETFTNITYTNSTASDGSVINVIETHTTDNLFSLIIYVVGEKTSVFNNIVTPKEVKIDFEIADYPFENQTSGLALLASLTTPFKIAPEQTTYDEEHGTASHESGVNVSSANRSGFFTWTDFAMVDNQSLPVNVTVVSTTEQTFTEGTENDSIQTHLFFSYPRGQRIVHDPKIGIVDLLSAVLPSASQGEYITVIYLATLAISGILFYGIVLVRKKR